MLPGREAVLAALAERVKNIMAVRRGSSPRFPSGLLPLDEAVGGGWVGGAVHEFLVSAAATAAHSIALRVAVRASPGQRQIVVIDSAGDFYPPGGLGLGLPLDRLLVVRTCQPSEVLWTVEQALRCRTVGAVLAGVRTFDVSVSRRLQLAAEAGGAVGLLIQRGTGDSKMVRSRSASGPIFAATRVLLEPLPSAGKALRLRCSVLKLREGRPCGPFEFDLPLEGDAQPRVDSPAALRTA